MKDSEKFEKKIENNTLGYWKSASNNSFRIHERVENDVVVKSATYLSLLNELLQGHEKEFKNLLLPQI